MKICFFRKFRFCLICFDYIFNLSSLYQKKISSFVQLVKIAKQNNDDEFKWYSFNLAPKV